jgi:hypothetical protein
MSAPTLRPPKSRDCFARFRSISDSCCDQDGSSCCDQGGSNNGQASKSASAPVDGPPAPLCSAPTPPATSAQISCSACFLFGRIPLCPEGTRWLRVEDPEFTRRGGRRSVSTPGRNPLWFKTCLTFSAFLLVQRFAQRSAHGMPRLPPRSRQPEQKPASAPGRTVRFRLV